jgi:4-hydroxybenzoyl-CoA thioesterase/acyl-CoA thioester hydrolase
MSKSIELPIRVYIEDTDAGGIVYYVNYLKFMERARTELLRSLGFGKTAVFSEELMFVVHSTQIKYLGPARLDELLSVTARIEKLGRTYFVFQQQVLREGEVITEAEVKVACVQRESMQPARLPASIVEAVNRD